LYYQKGGWRGWRPLRHGIRESLHEYGWQDWALHALVMVGVDAHFLMLGVEGKVAAIQRLKGGAGVSICISATLESRESP